MSASRVPRQHCHLSRSRRDKRLTGDASSALTFLSPLKERFHIKNRFGIPFPNFSPVFPTLSSHSFPEWGVSLSLEIVPHLTKLLRNLLSYQRAKLAY